MLSLIIIVEGKNDRNKLKQLLSPEVTVLCTHGTMSTPKLEWLKKKVGNAPVYLFLDNDASGRKIRAWLSDAFPDAEHLYTRKGYAGVEGTPVEYLIQQLEKAGLEDYIVYPPPPAAVDGINL